MISPVILRELEWYIRDYFFKVNKDENVFIDKFQSKEITRVLVNNYLRYRSSKFDELGILVDKVLHNLHEANVLNIDSNTGVVRICSKFDRKQCVNCFYINYISINEQLKCQRCNSGNLQEFPKKSR